MFFLSTIINFYYLCSMLRDEFGNLSQIDVRFGLFRSTYVECKNYSSKYPDFIFECVAFLTRVCYLCLMFILDSSVPLSDVAKFKSVLELNRISPSRGIFITTSTFVPRATTLGIRTVDGEQLRILEKQGKDIFRHYTVTCYNLAIAIFLCNVFINFGLIKFD